MSHSPKLLAGLRELEHYDAAICDVWGVVHNGRRAYERACAALAAFRSSRGPVLLLSNAPRPGEDIIRQLDALAVPRAAYDAVLTSGDATRAELTRRAREHAPLPVYHIGPDRDLPLIAGLPVTRVPMAEAALILCSGLFDDETETPASYVATLAEAAARRLPMICANPDLMVERGVKLIYCAGALAQAYEEKGGQVTYFGKPHAPIYRDAFAKLEALRARPLLRERIIAIGDGLRTDVRGANAMGLDVLLVTAGLHAAEFGASPESPDLARVGAALAHHGLRVIAAMPHLAW